ncbi:MAG: S8 family peptidase [Candidatus Eremiobacterota bacterium]
MTIQPTAQSYRPGEVLVRLKPETEGITDVFEDLSPTTVERLDDPRQGVVEGGGLYRLVLPEGGATEQAMARLQTDPRVGYAAPNHVYTLDERRVPDDLDQGFFGTALWGMEKIQAPEAWGTTVGAHDGPIVAVLDTGADVTHPDLQGNLWTNPGEIPGNGVDDDKNGVVDDVHGYNPAHNSGDLRDIHRHGTHTAGTIAAVGNNGRGVVGVNWEARVMPIRIFDEDGSTDVATIVKGLEYATRMGARITSNSWGGTRYNRALEEAFAASPALHVAAAGNSRIDNDRVPHYPSSFDLPNLVSVAASDKRDRLASFSNYGAESVDLAAPGVGIKSTLPGDRYGSMSGTSMACPHVAGVAALIATAVPQASNQEIKDRLLGGVDRNGSLEGKVRSGGRLNAARALNPSRH